MIHGLAHDAHGLGTVVLSYKLYSLMIFEKMYDYYNQKQLFKNQYIKEIDMYNMF